MNKEKDKKKIEQRWTKEQEELLAEWSEKASGYRWLHSKAEKQYRCRNYTFTIPVIILSTLTGTANFAMDSFIPENQKQLAMACVGGVNIFAGILSTLQNFLRYAELMEGHRLALVSWSKFSRDIAVELALEPKMRKPAFEFLSICRSEFDRLIEQSPSIDDDIVHKFKKVFKNEKVRVPEICNGIHPVKIYEPSKEEKVAEILSKASDKISHKSKSWRNVTVNKVNNIKEDTHVKWNGESNSKSDISDLHNLGKVSLFKNKISENMNEISDNNLTPNNELKKLIKINNELEIKSIKENDIEKQENDIEKQENDIEKNIKVDDICDIEDIDTIIPVKNVIEEEEQLITKIEEIELNNDKIEIKSNSDVTSFLNGIDDKEK
jgi:hypothetical protein